METKEILDRSTMDTKIDKMSSMERKLFELRMKINAGRKANKKEVVEEHKRFTDPKHGKKTNDRKDESGNSKSSRIEREKEMSNGGAEKVEEPLYLNDTVEIAQEKSKKEKKKKKREASFGWDVFNQDSLYNAYKKRLQNLPSGTSTTEPTSTLLTSVGSESMLGGLNYGQNSKTTKEGVNRMVGELEEREKARKNFSRRRQHYDEQDVDYINERNRHFNKKISRSFDKYTVEIRQNLERGTAI